MVVLVTGGAGFIGSHIVDALIERKYEVIIIDDLSGGQASNVNPKATLYTMDISDRGKVQRIFEKHKPEFIFHLAAAAKIPWCVDHPRESHRINVTATVDLLDLARDFKVKGFVFSSSSAVYGEITQEFPIPEGQPHDPISIYGLQKSTAERYCRMFHEYYGLATISLRYFNVYGTKRQRADGAYPNVVSAFKRSIGETGRVTIYGDGEQVRDFVHVFDVVNANLLCMDHILEGDKQVLGKVFNIGTGKTASINDIAKEFVDLPEYIDYAPARKGDPKYSCANIALAETFLDYKITVDLDKGLTIYFDSFNYE